MEHRVDDHRVVFDRIKNAVWKWVHGRPSHLGVYHEVDFRVLPDFFEGDIKAPEEAFT